jgi:hypothetical protein
MVDAELLGHESAMTEPVDIHARLSEIKKEVANVRLFKGGVFFDGKYIKDTEMHTLGYCSWQSECIRGAGLAVVYSELDAVEKAQEVHRLYEKQRLRSYQRHRDTKRSYVQKIAVITAAVDVSRPICDFAEYFIVAYTGEFTDSSFGVIKDTLINLGYPDHAIDVRSVGERTDAVYRDAARTRDELVAQVKARFKPYEEERIEAGSHRKH